MIARIAGGKDRQEVGVPQDQRGRQDATSAPASSVAVEWAPVAGLTGIVPAPAIA
jgi:hypothetical protein